MDHLLTCPVCYDPFDSDPSLFLTDDDRRTSHLPAFSAACSHKICASCLNNMQLAAMSDQTERAATKNPPKWFKCPCCTQKTAFNAVDMKVDLYACGWISQLKLQPHLFDTNPVEKENTKDLHVTAEAFLDMGSTRRSCQLFEEPTVENNFMGISSKPSKIEECSDVRRSRIKIALGQGKSFEELREMFCQAEEAHLTETFLKNGYSRRCLLFDHNFGSTTSRRKKRKWKLTKVVVGGDIISKPRKRQRKMRYGKWSEAEHNLLCDATKNYPRQWTTIANVVGSRTVVQCQNRDRRLRKQLKNLERNMNDISITSHQRQEGGNFDGISDLVARSRVGIFWPMDEVYYPATVISKKENAESTFTIQYDDGVTESIDLSKEKYMVLNEAAPFHSMDACAENIDSADMWACICGAVNQPYRKRCSPPCSRWKMGCKSAQKTALKRRSLAGGGKKTGRSKEKRDDISNRLMEAGSSAGSRPTRSSQKQIMLSKVGIGSRVSIFWEPNGVYFPATVIARHEEDSPYTFTYLYDDGDEEKFDLSLDKFQLLDDDPPEAAVAAISAANPEL